MTNLIVLLVVLVLSLLATIVVLLDHLANPPKQEIDPILEARAGVSLHRMRTLQEEARRKAVISQRAELTRQMMRADMAASRERRKVQ